MYPNHRDQHPRPHPPQPRKHTGKPLSEPPQQRSWPRLERLPTTEQSEREDDQRHDDDLIAPVRRSVFLQRDGVAAERGDALLIHGDDARTGVGPVAERGVEGDAVVRGCGGGDGHAGEGDVG